jgi:hypothetical protein
MPDAKNQMFLMNNSQVPRSSVHVIDKLILLRMRAFSENVHKFIFIDEYVNECKPATRKMAACTAFFAIAYTVPDIIILLWFSL